MSAYRDALTKLFLEGSFAKSDPLSAPQREKKPENSGKPPLRSRQASHKSRSGKSISQARAAAQVQAPVSAPSAASEHLVVAVRDHSHPGKLLAGKLRAHGKTASDLARDIRVPVNRVTAIINGQRGVTADTALRLGHWFDETPESWLDAQQRYELARARAEAGAEIRRLPRLLRSR